MGNTALSPSELQANTASAHGRTLESRSDVAVLPSDCGGVLWLTGMSGAGKSTIANGLNERLQAQRCMTVVLDGDALRKGLNADLGFSNNDRLENVRRTAEVAALFKAEGFLVICSLISPLIVHRKLAREIIGDRFFEVHISSSLACCEARDPKGLYARARRGEIPEFTGVSSAYEVPPSPNLTIDTASDAISTSVSKLEAFVRGNIRFARSPR
ncbi:adenylyl-sulfate kinase [Trinickia mobilis]|uniref:adenylyl-sulfate kinase n=1 Tax=Trinickia mobilis TaxID=2816356 RepID=UPI001F5CB06B|nr:adenylyl-sulfate kinase [Trinickia mobilis]